jgi:hypothetical protein
LPSFKQDRQKALRLLPSLLVMVCIHKPCVNFSTRLESEKGKGAW